MGEGGQAAQRGGAVSGKLRLGWEHIAYHAGHDMHGRRFWTLGCNGCQRQVFMTVDPKDYVEWFRRRHFECLPQPVLEPAEEIFWRNALSKVGRRRKT